MNKSNLPKNEERLTWEKFREMVEAAGVKDSDIIDSIDISWGEIEDLRCKKDEVFGWQIKL